MNDYKLADRAILMRLSISLPGENRNDRALSQTVKNEHGLGQQAGRWIQQIYPPEALEPVKKLDNEARAYHASVTLPFDAGIGILPAGLIIEHADKMRDFASKREFVIQQFLDQYDTWVDWAKREHNGTFDPKLYPGAAAIKEKFAFRTEPLPVPDAEHFSSSVSTLLGVDTESVNIRVKDACEEAQKELLRRLLEPVQAMATKLAEQPKAGKEDIVFRDTLVGNVKEIAGLARKLNISGDAAIEAFVTEVEGLTVFAPDDLRKDKGLRASAAEQAAAIAKKMAAYKL